MTSYSKTQDKTVSQHPAECGFACAYSREDPSLHDGRVCKLDAGACFNFSKPELVDKCPTLQANLRGEPTGATPDLDYPGPIHVVRQGPYGDFVTGTPPEYLTRRARKTDQESS